MLYKILITHHTSLYIFRQNLESLSKSPLHRFLRSVALTATISSTTPLVFLPSRSSLIPSTDLNYEECVVAFSYMCSTHKIHDFMPSGQTPKATKKIETNWGNFIHYIIFTVRGVQKKAGGPSCLFSNISTQMALLFCIRLRLDLLLGSRFWKI